MTTTPTSSGSTTPATTLAPAANPAVATAVAMLSGLPRVLPSTPPAPPPIPDPEVGKWVAVINGSVRSGVIGFINAGIHLISAQEALGHGRWLRMFNSCLISMSERTAEMLMWIARNQALANANHVSELPPTLTALYALSGGSVEAVTAGIQSGDINPEMSAKEARAFIQAQSGVPASSKPALAVFFRKRRTGSSGFDSLHPLQLFNTRGFPVGGHFPISSAKSCFLSRW